MATVADHTVKWHSKLYDKKVSMVDTGLKLNMFPHPTSKLSTQCKYGVITSELHRYNVACAQLRDFMQLATDPYATYLDKRYDRGKVDKGLDPSRDIQGQYFVKAYQTLTLTWLVLPGFESRYGTRFSKIDP